MSDKMFRYFYVYSKGGDDLNMEMFPAGPFLDQMLGEYVVLLGENGYQFDIDISDKEAEIYVGSSGYEEDNRQCIYQHQKVFGQIKKHRYKGIYRSEKGKNLFQKLYKSGKQQG